MNRSVGSRLGKTIALMAIGVMALGSPVLAQTAATGPAAQADAERLVLSEKLFSAMHLDTAMRGVFANMFKSMQGLNADSQTNPRVQAWMASFGAGMDAAMPDLIHDMAELYARVLTTEELRDSLKFYESPSGQAILSKMPEMMRQAMPLSMRLMPKIAAAAETDFCGKETCTDAERAIFARMKSMGANGQTAPAGGS